MPGSSLILSKLFLSMFLSNLSFLSFLSASKLSRLLSRLFLSLLPPLSGLPGDVDRGLALPSRSDCGACSSCARLAARNTANWCSV